MKNSPVIHFEMPAKDRTRVKKFYETVFGWDMKILGEEMGNYVLATTSESDEKGPKKPGSINGGFFGYDSNNPGLMHPIVTIQVDDIKQSMADVAAAGGKVLGEPMDIPGVGIYAAFEDSEGNRVSLLQPPRK